MQQLTRVYPLGLRMNSANYSPQEMWNSGCQLGEWGCPGWAGAVGDHSAGGEPAHLVANLACSLPFSEEKAEHTVIDFHLKESMNLLDFKATAKCMVIMTTDLLD